MRAHGTLLTAILLTAAIACGNGSVNGIPADDTAPLVAAPPPQVDVPTETVGCVSGGGEMGCPASPSGGAPDGGGSPNPPTADAAPPPPPVCHPPDVFGASKWSQGFVGDAVAGSQKQVTVHGEACLDCHLAPTNPAIPKFDFGGRVFDAQGKPASRVEVRLTNTTSGHPVSAYSNDDGYFWWPPPSTVSDDPYGGGFFSPPVDHVQFPSATGARSEQGVKVTMCATAPTGNCGSCHKEKSAPIIVKP